MTNGLPKRMRIAVALLGVLAVVATSCGGSSDAVEASSPAEAAAAPAATSAQAPAVAASLLVADTVSGGQIDFGALAGQDVVLWFWAPW